MKRRNYSVKSSILSYSTLISIYIFTFLSLSAPASLAQQSPAAGSNTSTSTELRRYNIPAQPLSEALIEFGKQSGLQVTTGSALVEGKQAPSVSGTLSAEQALNQLLAGNDLRYEVNGDMVRLAASESEAITLPQVSISGESIQESAYGPVEGYVAKRSATATKTDTPVIETPQSISVISRKDMDIRDVRDDIGDAAAYSSGVLVGMTGAKNLFGGSSIMIRGYGSSGSGGRTMNLHLDGLRFAGMFYGTNNLDPWLFERIEVLKGPASVLFGQSHPGGIVNQISKRPHDGMYNQIRFGSGNFDQASVAFDLGAELNDAWQLRIVGLGLDGETQQIYGERERYLIAPSLRWTNGATDLILLMHYQYDDINASFYNHAPRAAVFENPNGRIPLSFRGGDPSWDIWDAEIRSIGYLFSHQFNDALVFRQNLRYTYSGLKARRAWYNRPLDSSQRILSRLNIKDRDIAHEVTVDNQLQWKLTTDSLDHTLLIGIDYRRSSGNGKLVYGQAPSLDLFTPVYNQTFPAPTILDKLEKLRLQQTGIYIQDQIKAGNFSLLIGGRYDKSQSTSERKLRSTTTRVSDHAFTGRIGAIYNFNNGLAPYASYAESFEPVSGSAFDGSPFEPMEGKQYEVGVKYQPTGTDHLITLAAFDLTQENMLTADLVNPRFNIQIGEVQTRGIELEGKFSFNDNFQMTGAYTYLNDKVTESNTGNKGKRRSQVPEHNASLWANYSFNSGIFSGMGIGMGVRYIGKTEGDRLNTFSVPSYTLIDFAAHYDLGKSPLKLQGWQASLNSNNLFDRYYIAACFEAYMCHLGRKRAFRFSIARRF